MNHHPLHILQQWLPQQHKSNWLLATVIATERSSYRKPGAMMLFSERGDQLGVVSGGCLESDVFHQARRCWLTGNSRIVTYDMQDEGDVAWQLGIGCGGAVTLLLQPLTAANNYLHLAEVAQHLAGRQAVTFHHHLAAGPAICEFSVSQEADATTRSMSPSTPQPSPPRDSVKWFSHTLTPPPALLVLGGGVDAQPLVTLAAHIGWQVSVADPRARYARPADFYAASEYLDLSPGQLASHPVLNQVNAVVIMHHHVGLDAEALQQLAMARQSLPHLRYMALLGPAHRTERVLQEASLTARDLDPPLQSPAGFDIGGELPESIALSILSQAHAALFNKPYRREAIPCPST